MPPSKIKIILVAGARPIFMKVAPILAKMKEHPELFEPMLLHTGQHYDKNMSKVFFEDLGMPEPDIYLGIGSGSHAVQTATIMIEFEKVVLEHRPDWVLVVGDVNSTVACALVASKLGVKIVHVEAGLRSFDRTMPEEINRLLTDQIADLLLIPSPEAEANLIKENVAKEKIHFIGNIMIESLIKSMDKIDASTALNDLNVRSGEFVLLTLHRPSNVDDRDTFQKIISVINEIGHHLPVVFPAHPRTRKMMKTFGFEQNGLIMTDPIGYHDFLALQKNAKLVLTDSGGVQEETTFFGVPCLTIRENTERPVTVTEGTNELVGIDPQKIHDRSMSILDGQIKTGRIPQFWDDNVSARIVDVFRDNK